MIPQTSPYTLVDTPNIDKADSHTTGLLPYLDFHFLQVFFTVLFVNS